MPTKTKNKSIILTKTNYYDVYGIELAMRNTSLPDKYFLELLMPIAQKYLEITKRACRIELRHFKTGSGFDTIYFPENIRWMKENGISSFAHAELDLMRDAFYEGKWIFQYGGQAWGLIAEGGLQLEEAIRELKVKHIIHCIDRLNDLEHNNCLYLADCKYVSFEFGRASGIRAMCSEDNLYSYCSDEVRELRKFQNK